MLLSDIHIRDPYILPDGGRYYLYGTRGSELSRRCTGLDVYESTDLQNWSTPAEAFHRPDGFWSDRDYWAPEVHKYRGRYYLFVSFKSETRRRGTQILAADSPSGPFRVYSDGPVTPAAWECLDGTLYVDEHRVPYLVFCHEWVQTGNGEMCAMRLSDDLSGAAEPPVVLFRASDPPWAVKNSRKPVTDGPFLYRTESGRLLMLWSGFGKTGYVEAVSHSGNSGLLGPWIHSEKLLMENDGGHGMVFRGYDHVLYFVFHTPNATPFERPKIAEVCEKEDSLAVR